METRRASVLDCTRPVNQGRRWLSEIRGDRGQDVVPASSEEASKTGGLLAYFADTLR